MDDNDKVMDLINLASMGHVYFGIDNIHMIRSSVEAESYKIVKDQDGGKIGYVVWADVSEESFLLFTSSGIYPRFKYEWGDGDFCIVLDIYFHGQKNILLQEEIKHVFQGRKYISYARKGKIRTFYNTGKRWKMLDGSVCRDEAENV